MSQDKNSTDDFGPRSEKLKTLFSELDQELSNLEVKDKGSLYLSSNELSKSLFSKAPADFLESKSTAELVTIVQKASDLFTKFVEDKSQIIVNSEQAQAHTSFYISLSSSISQSKF